MVRDNPIPAGVYWVDIIDSEDEPAKNLGLFNTWAKAHAPNVKVLKKERQDASSLVHSTRGGEVWTLFRVVKPVRRWPESTRIGFPTLAPKGAETTRGDTGAREPEKGVSEYWTGHKLEMPSGGAMVALLLAGAWALSRR